MCVIAIDTFFLSVTVLKRDHGRRHYGKPNWNSVMSPGTYACASTVICKHMSAAQLMFQLSQQFRLGLFCNRLHFDEWDRVCALLKWTIYKCLWYWSIMVSMGNQRANAEERGKPGSPHCMQNSNKSLRCVLGCFCAMVIYVYVVASSLLHPPHF